MQIIYQNVMPPVRTGLATAAAAAAAGLQAAGQSIPKATAQTTLTGGVIDSARPKAGRSPSRTRLDQSVTSLTGDPVTISTLHSRPKTDTLTEMAIQAGKAAAKAPPKAPAKAPGKAPGKAPPTKKAYAKNLI